MNTNVIAKTSRELGNVIVKNSPTLLTALSVAGLITTVIFAVEGTVKAVKIVENEAIYRKEEEYEDRPIDVKDVIDLTWKCYLPTGAMALTTAFCMIGANHINLRRNAALASLYSLADTTLREYQSKVVAKIGEKKEEEIREELHQDMIDKNPPTDKSVILTGFGNYLCYDAFSKRWFRSDITKVQQAEAKFNQKLSREGWLNINYLYDLLGLEDIELGEEYGWIAERELLEFKFDTRMHNDSGEPALVVDYRVRPRHI